MLGKLQFVLFSILFIGCFSDRLNTTEAIDRGYEFLRAIADSRYSVAEGFYTVNFQKSEPHDARVLKFNHLNNITGRVLQITLLDSLNEQPMGEESRITLTYLVKSEKLTTKHTLVFVKDEGELRIGAHLITNN